MSDKVDKKQTLVRRASVRFDDDDEDDHDHLYDIKVEDHHDVIEVHELEDHHIELIKELHGDIHAVVHDPDDHHDHPTHDVPTHDIPTHDIPVDDAADISIVSDDLSPAPIHLEENPKENPKSGGFLGLWRSIYEFTTCVTVDMKKL